MKNNTMKKALSLFLAIVMIALALPLTILPVVAAEAAVGDATTIKNAKMFAKYSDGWDMHVSYGSVAGMIDGDPYNEFIDTDGDGELDDGEVGGNFPRSKRPYYESDSLDGKYTSLYIDSKDETRTYYGYAVFELNAMSALDDVTIWLTSNGYNEEKAAAWSDPTSKWGMNDGYEILVSSDGETWTFLKDFSGMCGDGTNKGANFPSEGDEAYASKTVDGFLRVGHKIALDGVEAKYVAVAVTALSKDKCIDIGEVTVNGTVVAANAAKKTPTQIYADAQDGDLLYNVNFKDMAWSDDFADHNNWNSYTITSEDGRTVRHLLHSKSTFGANNRRAMWGGIAEDERFALNGEKYTIYFDALFGSDAYNTYGVGIQVDGNATLVIDGFGCSYLYNWNTRKVNKSDDGAYKWNYYIDGKRTEKQSFAVEVDSAEDTMTLYVANGDGIYKKVRTLSHDDVDIKGSLSCKIYTTRVNSDKTINSSSWSEVSDVVIYKGLVADVEIDRSAEYANAEVGDLLQTINYQSYQWIKDFYSDSNIGAEADIAKDGNSVNLTQLNASYGRAIWGGLKTGYAFPLREVTETVENPDDPDNPTYVYGKSNTYTLVFDVDFGNTTAGETMLGIMVDGNHTTVVDGFGYNYWYEWNTSKVGKSDGNDGYDKWNYHITSGIHPKTDRQTFAIEIDPATNEMTLFIADYDGTFNKVRTLTYDGANIGNYLTCRISIRCENKSSGNYKVDEDSWADVSGIKVYKGLVAGQVQNSTGASVRMDVPTGIRFTGEFRKTMIDDLKAAYGADNVKLGMIITPTDYITDNGIAFEMAALDACTAINGAKYVKIEANTILDDGAYYVVNCALVNIQEGNYARSFSARAYIEVDGEIFKYADFDIDNNSRSIADVAAAAYGDVKDEANDEYMYPVVVGDVTKYSCYTDEQRKLFEGFFQ